MLANLALTIFVICLIIFAYFKYAHSYWSRKNVPYLTPQIPLGNIQRLLPKGISFGTIGNLFYNEFKKKGLKFGGVYAVADPHLVIIDPEYVKDILVKDFQYFMDRGIYQNEKDDPISANIFSQSTFAWKFARVKFTQLFTSGKMKMMLPLVLECAKQLKFKLESFTANEDVDILECIGCYTTDVIGTCVFGIECNSLQQSDNIFRSMGRRLFQEFTTLMSLKLFVTIYAPLLALKLGLGNIQKDISSYFFKCIHDTVKMREENNIHRPDLLEILINLKNNTNQDERITMNELTAQAFLFFAAGFETSSKTVMFTLYELGKNKDAQDQLRAEINSVLTKHNNEITYENIKEMQYLDQVMSESLRLYPALTTLTRKCTKNYQLRNTDITIDKGIGIMIPVLGLQRDPDYFPNPLKWDPERFSPNNKQNIVPFTYLPFGDGPRNCLGLRFGQIQSKIGIISVIQNFEVCSSPNTSNALDLHPDTFVTATTEKVFIRLKKL